MVGSKDRKISAADKKNGKLNRFGGIFISLGVMLWEGGGERTVEERIRNVVLTGRNPEFRL